MRVDLTLHIAAGGLAIVVGFVALFAAKGRRLHRKSGMIFVYAMIVMTLIGSTMAIMRGKAPEANVPVGLLTAYLVITALTTVRPPAIGSYWLDRGLMAVVLAVAFALFTFAFEALSSPKGSLHGMPAPPFLIFGAVALLAGVGDFRLIRSGGVQTVRGAPRLARHLWRMSLALAIAAFSFFLGQAKVIPKPYRVFPLLAIPPVVVLVALLYWLWRIRIRQTLRGISLASSPSLEEKGHRLKLFAHQP